MSRKPLKRLYPPLSRAFYDRSPATVAHELIGCWLVRELAGDRCVGRIVETEAYLAADDQASHSHHGPTKRNRAMFGPPGHAYVYMIHARWCLNAVTEADGVGSAVLVRAVEVVAGHAGAQHRRPGMKARDWARGPARLCAAFAVDRAFDGHDLCRGRELWISARDSFNSGISSSRRIGISKARELALRFFETDSPWVSGPKQLYDR